MMSAVIGVPSAPMFVPTRTETQWTSGVAPQSIAALCAPKDQFLRRWHPAPPSTSAVFSTPNGLKRDVADHRRVRVTYLPREEGEV
jgi:hypothetical protein